MITTQNAAVETEATTISTKSPDKKAVAAFLWGFPIGTLGGLIGLGGAEFRLPVLVGYFRYAAQRAVPLNLSVSLFTVLAALVTRLALSDHGKFIAAGQHMMLIGVLIFGGVFGAYAGARWVGKVSERGLRTCILFLLVSIGGLLLAEGFSHWAATALFTNVIANTVLGVVCGFIIGVVSSMLGVAGGELIIPTLVLAFGVDIKVAGTASLMISLPLMLVGIYRHWRNNAFAKSFDITHLILPMAIGSMLGSFVGAASVAYVSTMMLKIGLGLILIASAIKIFRH